MLMRKIIQLTKRYRYKQILGKLGGFSFSKPEKDHNLKFDEDQIRKKISELKDRKQSLQKNKQQKLQFMTPHINTSLARRIKKYRESTDTENLFLFTDYSLEEKPTILQITGYDEHSIEIDNMVYPPSAIVFPNQVLLWEVAGADKLTIDDFIILKYVKPKPTYVVVGLLKPEKFPMSILEHLQAEYKNVDVLQLFEATSQFNITANDDIPVVAFIISK